jgi:hypothetical protein
VINACAPKTHRVEKGRQTGRPPQTKKSTDWTFTPIRYVSVAGSCRPVPRGSHTVDEGQHTYCSNSARYLSRPLSPPGPSVAGHLGASMDRLCYQAHSERRANPADCIKSWSAIRAQGFI